MSQSFGSWLIACMFDITTSSTVYIYVSCIILVTLESLEGLKTKKD